MFTCFTSIPAAPSLPRPCLILPLVSSTFQTLSHPLFQPYCLRQGNKIGTGRGDSGPWANLNTKASHTLDVSVLLLARSEISCSEISCSDIFCSDISPASISLALLIAWSDFSLWCGRSTYCELYIKHGILLKVSYSCTTQ